MTVADALNGIRERTQEKTTAAEVLQSLRKNVASLQSVAAHGPVVIDPVHVLLLIDSELERLPENKIDKLEKRINALEANQRQHMMDTLEDRGIKELLVGKFTEIVEALQSLQGDDNR